MISKKLLFALGISYCFAANANATLTELLICNAQTVGGFNSQCIRNGEQMGQTPPTTLFNLYEQGWHLVAIQEERNSTTPYTFFLERTKN